MANGAAPLNILERDKDEHGSCSLRWLARRSCFGS